jgi:hypothetical protein
MIGQPAASTIIVVVVGGAVIVDVPLTLLELR